MFNSLRYFSGSASRVFLCILNWRINIHFISPLEENPSSLILQMYFMKTAIYYDKLYLKFILSISCSIYIFLLYGVFILLFIYIDFFLSYFRFMFHYIQVSYNYILFIVYFSIAKTAYLAAMLAFAFDHIIFFYFFFYLYILYIEEMSFNKALFRWNDYFCSL